MSDTVEVWREHWVAYAESFTQPLQGDSLVSRFVANRNVTGAYAEAWIRDTSKKMLSHRFRISTGAIVRPTDAIRGLHDVPQCDLIVWDPSELPGLFEYGDFALVPFAAARAIVEIKRTLPSKQDFIDQLRGRQKLLPQRSRVLGVVLRHETRLFDRECKPDWLLQDLPDPPITRLLDNDNRPDTDGILAFIYFLSQVAGHTRLVVGSAGEP